MLISCFALAIGLTACGGSSNADSDAVTGGEADVVKQVAQSVITDANKSCDLLTDQALEDYTRVTGARAVARCQRLIKRSKLPRSAKVVVLELGDKTASVGYRTSAQVTGAMTLVKPADQWMLDQVRTMTDR